MVLCFVPCLYIVGSTKHWVDIPIVPTSSVHVELATATAVLELISAAILPMLPASSPAFGAFLNAVKLLKGDMESIPSVAETTASKPSVSALCAPQHAPVCLESEPPRLQAPACQPVHSLQDPSCDAFSPSSVTTKYPSGPKGKGKAPHLSQGKHLHLFCP